jgi:hypothetical protein
MRADTIHDSDNALRRAAVHEAGHAVACLVLGIPMIAVTIADGFYLHRDRYRPPHGLGVTALVTMCLSGPAAETALCGPITDGGDRADIATARSYLGGDEFATAVEMYRLQGSAARLVGSPWAQVRIRAIAAALLARGTLTADQIYDLISCRH